MITLADLLPIVTEPTKETAAVYKTTQIYCTDLHTVSSLAVMIQGATTSKTAGAG